MSKTEKWFVVLLGVFIFGTLNFLYHVLETTSPLLNNVLSFFYCFLPWFLIIWVFFVTRRVILRSLFVLVLTPIALVSLLASFFISTYLTDIIKTGQDPTFELLQTINSDHFCVSVYRTDAGATTAYGIVVRQEKRLFPGLSIVRVIYSAYPAYEAEVTKLDGETIRISAGDHGPGQTIRLKPYVYF